MNPDDPQPKKGGGWLVLSRHKDQRIVISHPNGDRIVIMLVATPRRDMARIGVKAPAPYFILREELVGLPPLGRAHAR
jgi:sRNA-binding carbon storage regulator CsrA